MDKPIKKYGQDPILEAICEFHFVPSEKWNKNSEKLIHKTVIADFPEKKVCHLKSEEYQEVAKCSSKQDEDETITQFWSTDKNAIIQVSTNFICINHKKPYPTWKFYFPLIKEGLLAYLDANPEQTIARIQMTYINRIELPGNRAELRDYLNFYPESSDSLPMIMNSFVVGATIPVDDFRNGLIKLQINTSNKIDERKTIPIMMEISHRRMFDPATGADKALDWVEQSHFIVRDMFEASITSETKKLFGEPNND